MRAPHVSSVCVPWWEFISRDVLLWCSALLPCNMDFRKPEKRPPGAGHCRHASTSLVPLEPATLQMFRAREELENCATHIVDEWLRKQATTMQPAVPALRMAALGNTVTITSFTRRVARMPGVSAPKPPLNPLLFTHAAAAQRRCVLTLSCAPPA